MTNEKTPLYILLLIVLLLGGCKTYNSGTCLSDKEIEELAAKAEKGDLKAASLIESHYMYCAEDPKKARFWTEKRAALGDASAWYNLYSDDKNSKDEKERNQSLTELVKSAEGGYGFAQMTLADKYFIGNGVTKDYVQGEVWLLRAAQTGEPEAMRALSVLLLVKSRARESLIESYRLSRHAQKVVDEGSVSGLSAMRQAETIRQIAKKAQISEKALEEAISQLPPQKAPKSNQSAKPSTAANGSPRADAELANTRYAAGTKEGVSAGFQLLKSAASSCDTHAMSDLATLILLTATDRESLAEALSWAKLVILDAPESYMAEDARRNAEFVSIAAKSSGIPYATIIGEAERLMTRTNCNKKR